MFTNEKILCDMLRIRIYKFTGRDVILHQSCATKQEKKTKYEAETGGLVRVPSRLIIPATNNLFLQKYFHSFGNNLIPQLHINILY